MAANPQSPQPMKPRREMGLEVKEPMQFQFSKEGDTLSGVFLAIEPGSIKDKETGELKSAMKYFFLDDHRQRITCWGTADLDKKLWPGLLGYFLDVRYDTTDKTFQKVGQNAMKVFKVTPSKEKEPGFEHLGVAG